MATIRIFTFFTLLFFTCGQVADVAEAQTPRPPVASRSSGRGPQKQIATIVMSGLAGAMLGMSTLSFYGRPQDNLTNIAVGFAVGIIIGTTYTTYQATTQTREFYRGSAVESEAWKQLASTRQLEPLTSRFIQLGLQF